MRDDYTEWECYTHPDPDEDPPVLEEIQIVRDFVERYGTSDPIPANDAARKRMSLVNEDRVIEEREDPVVDKSNRISYLLWDVGIDIPRYQPPVLKLVEAIRALPELERTEDQIRAGRFEEKLKAWKSLEKFDYVWNMTNMTYTAYADSSIIDRWPVRHGLYPFYGSDEYHNAHAFYAHHLATYPPEPETYSRELAAAFRLIVFALEQDPWNHADQPEIYVPTDHIQMLNSDVHYMAPLFEVCGQVIFGFIGKYDLSVVEQLKLPGCNLWQGDSSFSMERWGFWKTRLRWISEQDKLMERTRDDARRIVHLMQETEQNN
ncbi:hypothetical protein N7488_007376 [Penicillium malachiteum]|nr:hypothetical protein N7488_007376 [Penicillium malachiteum]